MQHPDFARRELETLLLKTCEDAARAEGFSRFELAATVPGIPLYVARGYVGGERFEIRLANGESRGILQMRKSV